MERKKINLELVATSEDGKEIPIPQKPTKLYNSEVDFQLIKYKNKIFKVPDEMLTYFSKLPDVLEARINRAMDNGMFHMYPDGGYGCHYCSYMADNPFKKIACGEADIVMGTTASQGTKRCMYEGLWGVEWAGTFKHSKTGITIRALKPSCVVDDSMVVEIAERKLFDEYEVNIDFNFPTFEKLDGNPDLIKKFEIKESWYKRLINCFKRKTS